MHKLRDFSQVAKIEREVVRANKWNGPFPGDYGSEEVCVELFGLTCEMAQHLAWTASEHGPDDDDVIAKPDPFYDDERWDDVLAIYGEDKVAAFGKLGWDVTDGNGKPLQCLPCFDVALAVAAVGIVGKLAEPDGGVDAESWGSSLEQEARRFRSQRGR